MMNILLTRCPPDGGKANLETLDYKVTLEHAA